jgi:hypothetical protein
MANDKAKKTLRAQMNREKLFARAVNVHQHVIEQLFWEAIETYPYGFSSAQQDALSSALHNAAMKSLRTLEKEGPDAFEKLEKLSTLKTKNEKGI